MALHPHRLAPGDKVELVVTSKVGKVPGVITYAGDHGGHYIVDTEKHGRFAVSRGHEDLKVPA